jgi:hypothetical protein
MAKHFLMHKDELVNVSPQTKNKSVNIPIIICGNLPISLGIECILSTLHSH